ncbi:MAG: AAA family ATPase [Candidatus Micrarchaeota archaeon]|nr:AAA family ATPase [Candidatus Micrarchaeota archaeon]
MKARKRILVITGVPGTGKTSFSNSLAKRLHDTEVIHVTEVVNKMRLFTSRSRDGAKIVDMAKLLAELKRMIGSSNKRNILLESHLLCDMRIKGASALVLREHLDVLASRMRARRYPKEKIKSNIVSEATDYCGIRAERNYANVFEAFSTDRNLVGYANKLLGGGKPKAKQIELLPEFDRLIKKQRWLAA